MRIIFFLFLRSSLYLNVKKILKNSLNSSRIRAEVYILSKICLVYFSITVNRRYNTCFAHSKHHIGFLRNKLFRRELETAPQRLFARDRGIYFRWVLTATSRIFPAELGNKPTNSCFDEKTREVTIEASSWLWRNGPWLWSKFTMLDMLLKATEKDITKFKENINMNII